MPARAASVAYRTMSGRRMVEPPHPPLGCSCPAEADGLLVAATTDRLGTVSPSVYETARLVVVGAWLPGHRARIEHLLTTQRPDGGWGGPEAYALVPTLSAVDALLRTVLAPPPRLPAPMRARCVRAVEDGLVFAQAQLRSLRAADLPDTVAIEVIVPALVAMLQDGLATLRTSDVSGLDAWRGRVRLPLPKGMTDGVLRALTAALASDAPPPLKAMHSLESLGDLAPRVRGVPRLPVGTVGAAPAATAAWLGGPPAAGRFASYLGYLRRVIAQHGGPVACVIPITNFERAWVVNSLASAGLAHHAPRTLGPRMAAVLGRRAIGGGYGMPPDADTTSATLTALRHLGVAARDGLLRPYDAGTHFYTWPGERTASPTTNAHVLTALATSNARRTAWRTSAIQRIATWLCDIAHRDGFWSDKWHASPFYATACAVSGLREAVELGFIDAGSAARVTEVIDRAVTWVLASQQRNGSWGRWTGSAEETAYALQILLYRVEPDRRTRTAARRGLRFLLAASDHDPVPLWHGKELYAPVTVARAAVVGARHLAEVALGRVSAAGAGSARSGIPGHSRAILAG